MKQSRMANARLGIVLLALLLTLTACQARPRTQDKVPRMAPSVLKSRLDAGDTLIVADARTSGEYDQRHIPGAISIPLSDLEARMDELPHGETIVFY